VTLVAVADNKFAAGMTGRPYRVTHIDNALREVYRSDAHMVAYVLRDPSGVPQREQPRLLKEALTAESTIDFDGQTYGVAAECLVADVDNPGHVAHADDAAAIALASSLLARAPTAAVYATRNGARIVQPLDRRIPAAAFEPILRGWLFGLERAGVVIDWRTVDWTRHMRLPHVRREGRAYRSPALLLDRMRPIAPPTPAGHARTRVGVSGPLPDVEFAAELPEHLARLAADLAGPIGAIPKGRHELFLALCGAVLSQRRVPPEQLVAFATHLADLVGDTARVPWMARRDAATIARDTARKWLGKRRLKGYATLVELHPTVAAAIAPAPEPAPAADPAPPSTDLAEVTRRLTEAIRSAPDGLTVLRAQCGLGKTHAARAIAVERALRGGTRKLNTKTAIAVPTHALAVQVTADLRAAGVAVRRLFGPLSVPGEHEGYECRFRAAGAALAEGGQSVRRLYCTSCEYEPTCAATAGAEGPDDARIIVGPHALLAELDAEAGATGLLVVDEPPSVVDDELFTLAQIVDAESTLTAHFQTRYAICMAPALRAVRHWVELAEHPPSSFAPGPLSRAMATGVDAALLDAAFNAAGVTSAEDAVATALQRDQSPPLSPSAVGMSRSSPTFAHRLGAASRLLRAVHRALTRPGYVAQLVDFEERRLAITGLWAPLERALSREGRIVVMAADAHLYVPAYERCVGYPLADRVHDFSAGDGAPIERTLLMARAHRRGFTAALDGMVAAVDDWVRQDPATRRVGVVTFKRHADAVRAALQAKWNDLIDVDVRHYGAVRGLDAWREFDAVVTLGDPLPNLDAAARSSLDAEAAARAELEQAHGRLRTVHRRTPGRQLHVGRLMPGGWREPVTVRQLLGGQRKRAPADVLALELQVKACGGPMAVARALGISRSTVNRWLAGENAPDAAAAEWLSQAAAAAGGSDVGASRFALVDLLIGERGTLAPLHTQPVNDADGGEEDAEAWTL
jgi:hypothetical protein